MYAGNTKQQFDAPVSSEYMVGRAFSLEYAGLRILAFDWPRRFQLTILYKYISLILLGAPYSTIIKTKSCDLS